MEWDIDKRYLKLDILQGNKGHTIISSLNINAKISFNTTESVSGAVNEGNIVISGILPDKMAYIATTSTQWVKEAVQNRIVIDAGYENKGHGIIFEGIINSATPVLEKSNYTITIKALNSFGDMIGTIKSYSFEGVVKASRIANEFAKDLKFVFINELSKDVEVNNYQTKNKSIIDNIRYLAQITGLDVYIVNNRLYIKDRGKAVKSNTPLIIDVNNMVGVPMPTPSGVNVNVRLNPYITTGCNVKIKSIKYPMFNDADFILQSISHIGDTIGRDWYTRCVCFRQDLLNKV